MIGFGRLVASLWRVMMVWLNTEAERWLAWLSLFVQINPPDERRAWYWCWGSTETFLWTPWFKVHWRRDILYALKWHLIPSDVIYGWRRWRRNVRNRLTL